MAKPMSENFRRFAFAAELRDPRRDHLKRHPLVNIVTISLCAILCGANDWTEIAGFGVNYYAWFDKFLDLSNGIPSHDTFRRVFALLDPQEFDVALSGWLGQLRALTLKATDQVAIDGKALKSSFDQAGLTQPWLMVSAWATEHGLVLGQQGADGATGELNATYDLLARLDLKKRLVSLDALGCQKEIAEKIVGKQGDYLLSLKANHPTLEAAVRERFARDLRSDNCYKVHDRDHAFTVESSHGRVMTRQCFVLRDIKELPGIDEWKNVKAVVLVATTQDRPKRRNKTTDAERQETKGYRLFLTSREMSAQQYLQAVRNHWLIENQVHWSLDVTFQEDASRLRKDHGPSNMAILRRITLSLLKADPTKGSIKFKRKLAAWNSSKMLQFLGLVQPNQEKPWGK
jgi:predicted transposase YbfD/YdcC